MIYIYIIYIYIFNVYLCIHIRAPRVYIYIYIYARPVSIAPLGGGTYALSLWLPNSGTWRLNVTLAGAPVAGRWMPNSLRYLWTFTCNVRE